MAFELIKTGGFAVIDKDRNLHLKKRFGGQDFGIYGFKVNLDTFGIKIKVHYDSPTIWEIAGIDFPKGFQGSKSQILELADEALTAYCDLAMKAGWSVRRAPRVSLK